MTIETDERLCSNPDCRRPLTRKQRAYCSIECYKDKKSDHLSGVSEKGRRKITIEACDAHLADLEAVYGPAREQTVCR